VSTLNSTLESDLPPQEEPHAPKSSLSATLLIKLSRSRDVTNLFGSGFVSTVLALALQRVQSALRSHDIACPLTEDEIAVVLGSFSSVNDIHLVGDRLADLVQRAYVLQGETVYLGASLGIAISQADEVPPETLLKRAAIAMNQAMRSEPGTIVWFETQMEERMRVQHSLTGDLRKALPLRQLEVHYQPQVDLATCNLIGFEALARWKHPELGWISPGEFIPLAEEIGLIRNIGRWVLRVACLQAMRLPGNCSIAVNASPIQLKDGSILDAVQSALSLSGLPPARLEIEITEGILLEHSQHVRATLDALHSMGVKLALDDFGTGYSSLGQLATLPFDRIKIDRSLIASGGKNRAIVRAIALLGQGLELSTLAEGIESKEELVNAQSDGCTCGQGYLFGRAMPADQLADITLVALAR
jgi:predicted signal transduction protein with EAL and GGDEF domain